MFFKKIYHCVLQHDEKDCGPACILTILKQYNVNYSIANLREIVGTDKNGTNLYGMIKGLNYFNFNASAVKIEEKKLDNSFIFPIIAHVTVNNMFHYVVIHKISNDDIIISDPAKGVLKMKLNKFYDMWTGILILVEKNDIITNSNYRNNNFLNFFRLIKMQKKLFYNIIIVSFFSTLLGIGISFYFKILIDYVLSDKLENTLNILMIGIIFITLIKLFFEFIRNQLVLFLSKKIDEAVLFGYYKHVIKLPFKFFHTRKTGEILSRFSDGVNIREIITEIIFNSTIDIFLSLFGGLFLYYINRTLFLITIAILLIYLFIILIFKKYIKNKNLEVLEDNSILTSNIIENINGIETIKLYNLENYMQNETEMKFLKFLKSSYERGVLFNIINFVSDLISNIGNYIIVWIGTLSVISGELSLGDLLVFLSMIIYFLEPLKKIIGLQFKIQIAIVASDRIGEIIELEEEKKNKQVITDLQTDLEITNLKFRYGTRNLILDDINIKIKNKQKVAFVGESGSGKTTLAKLLLKYYDYEEGSIKLGYTEIRDIDTTFLRDKIAYISQETFLFNKTIRENLFINEQVEYKKVMKLLEKLKLLEFINSLPNKLETVINENGINLSGGQKQRLSILRAILKEPNILIMDEATSNLDVVTEKAIQDIIEELDITTIIIAHRLSTIKKCDNIFVFKNGKISESGNHEKLMKLKGDYFNYWKEMMN